MKETISIERIGVYKLRIPLKEPFITSLGSEDSADNIIITISTDAGITGFGECNPYMPINGESIDTCFAVAQYFAKALKGKNPLQTGQCLQLMDRIIYGNNSIKSAFDMALHDITGQYKGVSLYQLFGGKNNKVLSTGYTVSIDDAEKMAADALKIKEAGYDTIKVKLGGSKNEDVQRIKLIRKAVGKKIPLRIDANQGWDEKTAIAVLQALDRYGIDFCEEPIPRWNYMQLRKIKKKSPIPIMADESCSDHHDAERLIRLKACDMFNIKVGKAGGLANAFKIVKQAEKAVIKLQVGAFMESRLAMTASAHLALCSKNILYCDFDTPLMHAEDYVVGGLTYHEHGVMKVPGNPGLGASLPQDLLDGLEQVVV